MRVVCIHDFDNEKDRERTRKLGEIHPVKGQIYHVRDRFENQYGPHYRLAEIINKPRHYFDGFDEVAFHQICFRPVTDISDLIKLTKVRELEDA